MQNLLHKIFTRSLAVVALLAATNATAEVPPQHKPPSTPPTLGAKIPSQKFRCNRWYRWKDQVISCDSALGRDGEGLRPILAESTQALDELNRYQKGRKSTQILAYTGSAGLIAMALSKPLGSLLTRDRADRTRLIQTQQIIRWGGLGLFAGSLIGGALGLSANERHLEQAISIYNSEHPEHPIEFHFQIDF